MSFLPKKGLLGIGIATLFLAGCRTDAPYQVETVIPSIVYLTPYLTTTSTLTPEPPQPGTATPISAPSPTPRLHPVQSGETLLLIAAQYGISLEELLLANPEVNPSLIPVGSELVIPDSLDNSANVGVTEPLSLTIQQQSCFPTGDGGISCLVLVKNDKDSSVESVSLVMRIIDQNGSVFSSQITAAPLNILLAGGSMPIAAYFPPPQPVNSKLNVEVSTALPYQGTDQRYLPVNKIDFQHTLSEDGRQAVINGMITIQDPERIARLSVLASAYTREGSLIAMRVWRMDFPEGSTAAIPFELVVNSLGGEIDRVDILAEAEARD